MSDFIKVTDHYFTHPNGETTRIRTCGKEVLEIRWEINGIINMQIELSYYRPASSLQWWERFYLRIRAWTEKWDARFAARYR